MSSYPTIICSTGLMLLSAVCGTVWAESFLLPLQIVHWIVPLILMFTIFWRFDNIELSSKIAGQFAMTDKQQTTAEIAEQTEPESQRMVGASSSVTFNTKLSMAQYARLIFSLQLVFYILTAWIFAVFLRQSALDPRLVNFDTTLIAAKITTSYLPYLLLSFVTIASCALYQLYYVLVAGKAPYLVALISNKPAKFPKLFFYNALDLAESKVKLVLVMLICGCILWQITESINAMLSNQPLSPMLYMLLTAVLFLLTKQHSQVFVGWMVRHNCSLGTILLSALISLTLTELLLIWVGSNILRPLLVELPLNINMGVSSTSSSRLIDYIDQSRFEVRFDTLFLSWLLACMPKLISTIARYSYGIKLKAACMVNIVISLAVYFIFTLCEHLAWNKLQQWLAIPGYQLLLAISMLAVVWLYGSYIYTRAGLYIGAMVCFRANNLAGGSISSLISQMLPLCLILSGGFALLGWLVLQSFLIMAVVFLLPLLIIFTGKMLYDATFKSRHQGVTDIQLLKT